MQAGEAISRLRIAACRGLLERKVSRGGGFPSRTLRAKASTYPQGSAQRSSAPAIGVPTSFSPYRERKVLGSPFKAVAAFIAKSDGGCLGQPCPDLLGALFLPMLRAG